MREDMKSLMIVFFVCVFYINPAFTQAPVDYYTTATGKTRLELKTALHNKIKGHTTFPYSSRSTDVWDILKESDRDPANPDNVILFYTGWSVNAAQEYNNNTGWNREHVWAKSHGPFDENVKGPGTDCHHLRPADISVNAARGNLYFDNAETEYIDPSGATGCMYNISRYVWEPRDVEKGDAARMIFYMATRYEGEDGFPDLEVVDNIPTNTSGPLFGDLSTLIEWNKLDPVDAFEMNRNNVVFSYQKNRNPFIDHPEYIDLIWGSPVQTINVSPVVSNVSYSPSQPTSADVLQISANAIDSDGFIKFVFMYWGYNATDLINVTEMLPFAETYSTTIPQQIEGTNVYFKVIAWDNLDSTNISEVQNITVATATGLPKTENDLYAIYPNPASSFVHINHNSNERVVLYSIEGKKLMSTQDNTLDIAHLKNGIYLIQIMDSNNNPLSYSRLIKE